MFGIQIIIIFDETSMKRKHWKASLWWKQRANSIQWNVEALSTLTLAWELLLLHVLITLILLVALFSYARLHAASIATQTEIKEKSEENVITGVRTWINVCECDDVSILCSLLSFAFLSGNSFVKFYFVFKQTSSEHSTRESVGVVKP